MTLGPDLLQPLSRPCQCLNIAQKTGILLLQILHLSLLTTFAPKILWFWKIETSSPNFQKMNSEIFRAGNIAEITKKLFNIKKRKLALVLDIPISIQEHLLQFSFFCKNVLWPKFWHFKKIQLTSVLDVHDVGEEGGDALCPALPHGVPHHPLKLLPEQLKVEKYCIAAENWRIATEKWNIRAEKWTLWRSQIPEQLKKWVPEVTSLDGWFLRWLGSWSGFVKSRESKGSHTTKSFFRTKS